MSGGVESGEMSVKVLAVTEMEELGRLEAALKNETSCCGVSSAPMMTGLR